MKINCFFSGDYNIKYLCSGFLCCVGGLVSVSEWLILWFLICGMVQVLFLIFNNLKTWLNPICHLLALLEAHHILHISRVRVNFPIAIILLQPMDSIFSQVHILKCHCFCGIDWLRIAQSKGTPG